MNDNDIQKVAEGQKIAELALQLMRKKEIDRAQLEKLREFAGQSPHTKDFAVRMSDEFYLRDALDHYNRNDKTEHAENLIKRIYARRRRRTRIRILYTVSAAAVAIVIGLFLLWNMTTTPPSPVDKPTAVDASVPPETPAIILESGETIILPEAGPQIKIGNTVVDHTAENKIVYPADSKSEAAVEYHTLNVPRRSVYTVVLSDKTEVTLNAGSRLTYPKQFSGGERKVVLEGEGYFKVAKSETSFTVSTKTVDINVLGTVFNVCMNRENRVEAILLKGSISLDMKEWEQDNLTMIPGQMFTMDTQSGDYILQEVDSNDYLGWIRRSFKTNNKPMSNLTDQIAAWHGVKFVYNRQTVKTLPVSVLIDANLELEQVILILEALAECRIINNGGNEYEIR
ncbi:MAG: FecR domain-containing protein [Prevotellaceae bacterium]|jgi:ferric-dicitrate binding protein FerR (iron transport regulator)|nr:FecR domain-containing protein [Prevotellaceae bacterium]